MPALLSDGDGGRARSAHMKDCTIHADASRGCCFSDFTDPECLLTRFVRDGARHLQGLSFPGCTLNFTLFQEILKKRARHARHVMSIDSGYKTEL